MTKHIDQMNAWWQEADNGIPKAGDTIIADERHRGHGFYVYQATKGHPHGYDNIRILHRAPAPKPAWHDAVAVIARSVFDEADMYSGRRVMMRAGFGDERWWDSSNEKHWEDDELTDVTPLIEQKVTDEMVARLEKSYADHADALLPFGALPGSW